jgi:hypothetical protein
VAVARGAQQDGEGDALLCVTDLNLDGVKVGELGRIEAVEADEVVQQVFTKHGSAVLADGGVLDGFESPVFVGERGGRVVDLGVNRNAAGAEDTHTKLGDDARDVVLKADRVGEHPSRDGGWARLTNEPPRQPRC